MNYGDDFVSPGQVCNTRERGVTLVAAQRSGYSLRSVRGSGDLLLQSHVALLGARVSPAVLLVD